MAKENKYSIRDFKRDFPTDQACLGLIFDTLHSRTCSCGGTYKPVKGRRQFYCTKCHFQIAPTAGTIFHKSDTPLTLWFHAIFVFSNAKSGISAKEMERQLGVTYKTAWRFLMLIRKALGQGDNKLTGDVEIDSSFFEGKGSAGKDNINLDSVLRSKSIVTGAIQRGGHIKAMVTNKETAVSIGRFLSQYVEKTGTRLMTDGTSKYKKVAMGYNRHSVNHKRKEFARGDVQSITLRAFGLTSNVA